MQLSGQHGARREQVCVRLAAQYTTRLTKTNVATCQPLASDVEAASTAEQTTSP